MCVCISACPCTLIATNCRTDFKFAPKICGQEIDLHQLYKTVTAAGGSGKVSFCNIRYCTCMSYCVTCSSAIVFALCIYYIIIAIVSTAQTKCHPAAVTSVTGNNSDVYCNDKAQLYLHVQFL